MQQNRKYLRTMIAPMFVILGGLLLLNIVVDPFNRNQFINLNFPKQEVSALINYQIFKILEFENNPKPVIILGDSRAEALQSEYFVQAGRSDVYNLAFGGGTLYEAIDAFWFAVATTELEQVVLGVPFNIYTEANSMNRFPTARQVSRNFFSYYFSSLVTKASMMNILTAVTGRKYVTEEPDMSRDAFWSYQLGVGTARHYESWAQPKVLLARLKEVVEHCKNNNIDLVFWIPPTHVDLQNKVAQYGLEASYVRYKEDLNHLGTVLDYDESGKLTRDAENFTDPYHFNDALALIMVADLIAALAVGAESGN